MVQTAVAEINIDRPAPVAAGKYTDIVEITAPSSASAGDTVSVKVKIKNIDSFYDHAVACVAIYDGSAHFIDELVIIPSLKTYTFSGSFTMPSRDITIYAYSWYPYYQEWILDDEATKDVSLTVAEWVLLATKNIPLTIAAPPEKWVLAAERDISLTIAAPPEKWVLMAERNISLDIAAPPEEWILLATKNISLDVAAPPTEWVLLTTKTITLTPITIPPYELIQHTIYPFAYIYDGDVEVTIATFKTDPFTPAGWLGSKFASKLEDEVRARGGRPIEVKVYVDTTPLLWTNFRIEVTATPLGEVVGAMPGMVAAIPLWAAILIVALAIIAVIVVATLAIKTIVELFHHYPELKEVKPGWSKETLIMTIQDSEEYWERIPTPIDTLEAMSEAELRDQLDQIAEEEIPPPAPSPWAWIILGAAGILAGGFVISQMAKKK